MWRRNLYAAWLAQILSVTGFGFVLPFIPFYIQELGVTDPDRLRLWTGILSSAPALSMAIMAPVWGLIADRRGKKVMLLRAMLTGAVIISLLGTTRSVQAVLVLRILQGALTGTVTAAGALVASGTPRDKLGFALGLLSSSTFIGISIGPAVGGVVAELVGYRQSFLLGGFMLALGFVCVLFLVRETEREHPEARRERKRARSDASGEPGAGEGTRVPFGFLTGGMVGLFVLIMMLRFVRSLPVPFLPLYVQELRGQLSGSVSVTGYISAARGVVAAVAAIALTRVGDRHSRLLVVGLLVAVAGVLSLPIFFSKTIWVFSVWLLLATFFLGGVEPLVQAELSSRVAPTRRGLLFGIQTSIANMGWFAAPMVGSVVSIRFGIPHIFLTMTLFLFITVAIVFVVKNRSA
jgi:DHA1 family multidrug resistance protein-like MFS transporter